MVTIQEDSSKQEIWVLAERHGERWDTVTLELLQDAQSLAKKAGWHVVAFVFSKPNIIKDSECQELAANGANEVVLLENEEFCQPNGPLTYSGILAEIVKERPLHFLLSPSTPLWVECAGALITKINGFIVSNAMSFRILPTQKLEVTRYGWENKVQLTLTIPVDQPCAVCLRPNVAGVGKTNSGQKAKIVRLQAEQKYSGRVQVKELLPPDPRELDLVEADRIVAGGRGVGQDGFELLEKLAGLLEAGVGATRVAVDLGWVPYSRQIGQTGKTVKPRLYIAFGISGAAQHVDGMKQSEVTIAINTDPKASIFELADLKVVGDANEIINALIEQLSAKTKTKLEVG